MISEIRGGAGVSLFFEIVPERLSERRKRGIIFVKTMEALENMKLE